MSDDSATEGNKGDSGTEGLGRTEIPEESPDTESDARLSKQVADREGEDEKNIG